MTAPIATVAVEAVSPQLAAALHRCFGRESREYAFAAEVFSRAMQNGGSNEVDFVRPPDVSYNPRPARVALILLKDAKETSIVSILGAMLETCKTDETPDADDYIVAAEKAARLAAKGAQVLVSENGDSRLFREASLVVLASTLDRIRHLHQAPDERLRQVLPRITESLPSVISLGERFAPILSERIAHWQMRVAPTLVFRQRE